MERNSRLRMILISAMAVMALVILYPAAGTTQEKEVKVGVLLPLSGPVAESGEIIKHGAIMAAEEINAAGGIPSLQGAKLKLYFGDTMAKPEVGATEAERLILNEKVVSILGAFNSVITMSSSTVSERYKIPYVVVCSILDDITGRGYKYLFRHTPTQTMIGTGQVTFLKDMSQKGPRIKRIALVYDLLYKNITLLVKNIILKESEFEIVMEEGFSPGQIDMTPTILRVKSAKPDVIMAGITGAGDAILFFRTLHETNLDCMGILGGGAAFLYEPTFAGAGKLMNYSLCQDPWTPRMPVPAMQSFIANYKKKHKGEVNVSTAEAYTATYILAEALKKAGSTKPEDIRNALASLDINVKDRNHPALIAAAYRVKFGPDGQNPYVICAIEQVFDQKTTTVYPPEVAQRLPAWPVPPWSKR